MAQAAKAKGNAAFKAGDYPAAIGQYTAAILADNTDFTFPLNRAAAYLKLGKNEDAERDCTTVLSLSALNAKALFRRGQARLAMERLDEAMSDLNQASKREPANEAIKVEMNKLAGLIQKKKAKASKSKSDLLPSTSAPTRRRVPITIIDAASPPTASTSPAASSQAPPTPQVKPPPPAPALPPTQDSPATDTLHPISTRSLKPSQAPPVQAPPDQPPTFQAAKQARQTTKPSRVHPQQVGGGIFRASGESTVFPARPGPSSPAASPSPQPAQAQAKSTPAAPSILHPIPPQNPPTTCFEFMRAWDATSTTAEHWGLILSVPPPRLPALFKTSLEPAQLAAILGVFRDVLHFQSDSGLGEDAKARVREYLDALARVERFGTVVLFLSAAEKRVGREVWEALGVTEKEKAGAGSVWAKLWA